VLGGFLGAIVVWLAYLPHWGATPDGEAKLAVFCTAPAIRSPGANVITEIVGTFVLVLGILAVLSPANLTQGSDWSRGLGPLLVGVIVWSIGLSLGGPTGYAINPARDLGPRLAHAVLPLPSKGSSDWGYAWVPIVGPIIGGVLGALCYQLIWK
ncbi:MAG TPA: MIP/aquaporin family protein, partial [Gemmatimonadaceae bacterium]|nr:MIP/aquaporin family protein [Gemmatimonadaceae bacterium]